VCNEEEEEEEEDEEEEEEEIPKGIARNLGSTSM
jgi:hypothetical protein